MKRSEKEIEAIFKKYYPYLVLFSKKTSREQRGCGGYYITCILKRYPQVS